MNRAVEYLGMCYPENGKWIALDKQGNKIGTFPTKDDAENAVSQKGKE